MNWVDYVIVAIISFSALISLLRGFVREAISLLTWIVAFWVAFKFSGIVAELLSNFIKTPFLRLIFSFALLFIIVLILGALVNFLVAELVSHTGLNSTDRLLGVLFGIVRGVLLVVVLILLCSITDLVNYNWWQQSVLIPYFQPLVSWFKLFLPENYSIPPPSI